MAKSPARVLRDKGLIPREWNLTKLTSGQKSRISFLLNEKKNPHVAAILKHPDRYVVRDVGKETAANLKRAGYQVNKAGRALIYTRDAKVTVNKLGVTFRSNGMRSKVLLMSRPDFLARVEAIRRNERQWGGRIPGRRYALKVGNSPRFNTTYPTLNELLAYARARDKAGWHSDDARDHISLVVIDEDGNEYGGDDGEND